MPTLLRPRQGVAVSRTSADEEHARRMLANLIAMIACLLLIGAGLFVVEGLNRPGSRALRGGGPRRLPTLAA